MLQNSLLEPIGTTVTTKYLLLLSEPYFPMYLCVFVWEFKSCFIACMEDIYICTVEDIYLCFMTKYKTAPSQEGAVLFINWKYLSP